MPLTRARLRISDYQAKRKHQLKGKEHRVRMISLSLTSMVDMFAILVIFLLTNAGAVQQWIEIDQGIQLPRARASDPPPEGATIQVTKDNIYGDKVFVLTVAAAMKSKTSIEPIQNYLKTLAGNKKKGNYVNIVSDAAVPFGAVRRIIASCQDAGYSNVNLAIQPAAQAVR